MFVLDWRSGGSRHRRIVPWYSMAEWYEVYKQIFSDDTAAQTKGLERLLLWGARYPQRVPIGVQCTTDLLQVCLKDRELWPKIVSGEIPQYNEQYLQSMYAVAVMRFLNHATSMCTTKISMYVKARELDIPDWVVNVRHETAHSPNLAPLNVLRNAADFCLNWIHENYWKNEMEYTADWVLCEKVKDVKEIFNILEMWKAVILYSKIGITSVLDIPDVELQKALLDLLHDSDSTVIQRMKTQLKTRGYTMEKNEMENVRLTVINEFVDHVNNMDAHFEIIELLLETDGFLPSKDFISVFDTQYDKWRLENNSLPIHFISLWMSLLEFLPQNKIIPTLLNKLIQLTKNMKESSHRKKMAAFWVNELALSLYKVKQFEDFKHGLKFRWFNGEEFYKRVIEEVEEQDLNLKQIVTLNMQKLPKSVTDLALLNEVLEKPNQWTSIYLSSVMDIMDPPLTIDTKHKLTKLVQLCTQELSTSDTQGYWKESPVYTIANLMKTKNVEKADSEEILSCTEGAPENIESDWIRCERSVNWGRCPLGKLPWQDKGSEEKFIDLSMNTVWHIAEQSDVQKLAEQSLPGYFHEKIDVNKMKSKSPLLHSSKEERELT